MRRVAVPALLLLVGGVVVWALVPRVDRSARRPLPSREVASWDVPPVSAVTLQGAPRVVTAPEKEDAEVTEQEEGEGVATPAFGDGRHLVLVAAETDRATYVLGEPVRIRRVFENVGDRPARITARDWTGRRHGEVGITSAARSRLAQPAAGHLEEVVIEVGERIGNEIVVELDAPGSYTIEVPPEYQVRGSRAACFRLPVTVVEGDDPRILEEKVERLGRAIALEEAGSPSCWTDAQSDLRALGPVALPHARRWLRQAASAHLRAIAAKMLGALKDEGGIEALVRGLEDADEHVREMSLESLRVLHRPETLAAILPLLHDPAVLVRIEAVWTAAAFVDAPEAGRALRETLQDGDLYVRTWAAVELAEKRRDAAGIGVLIAALRAGSAGHVGIVAPALQTLTGRSFGEAGHPSVHSSDARIEEAVKRNEDLAARWLAWWEEEGRARFGTGVTPAR